MKAFLKRKTTLIILGLLVVGGGYLIYRHSQGSQTTVQYLISPSAKTTIISTVTGAGQVSAQNQLDIKPQSSNMVTKVFVKNGDDVRAWQTLVTLDEKNALTSLSQAKAALEQAQANYQKLLAGATSQDIAVSKASVDAAQTGLDNAKTAYNNSMQEQKIAVANAYSTLLNTNLTAVPAPNDSSTATISISGAYLGTTPGSYTISLYNGGGGTYYTFTGLENGNGAVIRGTPIALGTNGLFTTFSSTGNLNTTDTWTITLPNTQGSSYLSNYNAYQTALQTQSQSIASAQTAIDNAQNNLGQAQAAYELKIAQAQPADVAAAQAQIDAAQAQMATAETAYQNNVITAPFDGRIAAVNVQVGDQASSGTAVATLITKTQLAVISLNEVDAAKIKIGQKATLTFDALPDFTVTGAVSEIDTLGTVSQGVVNYNVKIALDTQSDQIKPGMSVNANIIIDSKSDVLAVPNGAVKTNGNQRYVQVLNGNTTPVVGQNTNAVTTTDPPQQIAVTVGLNDDTMTEITSGLTEGQTVVVQTINSPSGTGGAAAQTGGTVRSGAGAAGIRIPGLGGGGLGGR